jgi:hypothetical protein
MILKNKQDHPEWEVTRTILDSFQVQDNPEGQAKATRIILVLQQIRQLFD